jgi:1,6-anhydro-N-acetylmuramate kinase
MDAERDAENRKWFKNNGSRKKINKRPDSEDDTPFENTVKIRVKFKDGIREAVGEHRALDWVAGGSGGPL